MKAYNPLELPNIARQLARELLRQEPGSLPPGQPFIGGGIYALYYSGPFPLYAAVSSKKYETPIYVGESKKSPGVFSRLSDHAASIDAATNLQLSDFRCRYLVVEDVFIVLAEDLLIQGFRPVWNGAVTGFGLHDPGAGRHAGKRSDWDELHPGRSWHGKMAAGRPAADIELRVGNHFLKNPPRPPADW